MIGTSFRLSGTRAPSRPSLVLSALTNCASLSGSAGLATLRARAGSHLLLARRQLTNPPSDRTPQPHKYLIPDRIKPATRRNRSTPVHRQNKYRRPCVGGAAVPGPQRSRSHSTTHRCHPAPGRRRPKMRRISSNNTVVDWTQSTPDSAQLFNDGCTPAAAARRQSTAVDACQNGATCRPPAACRLIPLHTNQTPFFS